MDIEGLEAIKGIGDMQGYRGSLG